MYNINTWNSSTKLNELQLSHVTTTLDDLVTSAPKRSLRERVVAGVAALSLIFTLGGAAMACDKGNGG
jgi:hypothetical protein